MDGDVTGERGMCYDVMGSVGVPRVATVTTRYIRAPIQGEWHLWSIHSSCVGSEPELPQPKVPTKSAMGTRVGAPGHRCVPGLVFNGPIDGRTAVGARGTAAGETAAVPKAVGPHRRTSHGLRRWGQQSFQPLKPRVPQCLFSAHPCVGIYTRGCDRSVVCIGRVRWGWHVERAPYIDPWGSMKKLVEGVLPQGLPWVQQFPNLATTDIFSLHCTIVSNRNHCSTTQQLTWECACMRARLKRTNRATKRLSG